VSLKFFQIAQTTNTSTTANAETTPPTAAAISTTIVQPKMHESLMTINILLRMILDPV
jgi:hypothetical protein